MNTWNWQIKILTFCIAAIALCLTAACERDYPLEEVRITPSAPCGDDAHLVPSVEFIQLLERLGMPATTRYVNTIPGLAHAVARRKGRLAPEKERVWTIVQKYRERLSKHTYIYAYGPEPLIDENGWQTDKIVVVIDVIEMVDQNMLPSEDRISECMDGIPVHYRDTIRKM